MKWINHYIFAFMAMFMLSFDSVWAQYVKVTAEDGTVSWAEIDGIINGSNIEIYQGEWSSAIDSNTKGSLDLNEVWARSGGRGTHYQVTSIGKKAFSYCSGLISVEIPSSVKSIGESAFSGCSGLTSISIPSGVTSIGDCVFGGCSSLTSISISSSVKNIGNAQFYECGNLASIVVDASNPVYDSRNNCNAIIETATNTLIFGCYNTIIPSSVTSIGNQAFLELPSLTSIEIPSSVTSIGEEAFQGCINLNSILIAKNVTKIGPEAFQCTNLTSIILPEGLTEIEGKVFSACYYLTSVTIPSSVTSIGDAAFADCDKLTFIDIPSSVTSIGDYAFYNCWSLTSITIPSSVTSIGDYAFSGCSGLTSVISKISVVFETGENAFEDCNNATLYVPENLLNTYKSTQDWNRITKIEELPGISLEMSCNNKGKVLINGDIQFTNDMDDIPIKDVADNIFEFIPHENYQLRQVLIDGKDVTKSVKNNKLTMKIHEGSKMLVMFSYSKKDVNGDGQLDISDVVKLVNMILGQ